MKTTLLDVAPGPWSGWEVRRAGAPAGITFGTRTLAVDYARAMAEGLAPARVRVQNRNGGTDLDWWARADRAERAVA